MLYNEGSAAQAATAAVNAPSGNSPATVNPPNEGLYGEYQAQADHAYDTAKASITARRQGIMQQAGFSPDGQVNGMDPTGQYQQLKNAQAQELQQAENQAQERGLGGHGLGAQVAEAPRFQEDVDSANFANNYLGALDANSTELSNADATHSQALLAARQRQIEDDIANGRYDVAAPDDSSDTTTDDSTPGPRATAAARRIVKTPALTTALNKKVQAASVVGLKSPGKAPAKALAARSAGMNALYNLKPAKPAPKPKPKPTVYNGRH